MKNKISFGKVYNGLKDEEKRLMDAELSVCELEPKDMPLTRATFEIKRPNYEMNGDNEDENTSAGWISRKSLDWSDDIVIPSGCITKVFEKNPVVFFNHDQTKTPVAKCVELKIMDDGVWARWEYADTTEGLEIKKLVKGGFLSTLSIGFIPISYKLKGQPGFDSYGYPEAKRIIEKWVILEFSITNVPDNPNASIVEKAKLNIKCEGNQCDCFKKNQEAQEHTDIKTKNIQLISKPEDHKIDRKITIIKSIGTEKPNSPVSIKVIKAATRAGKLIRI